MDSLTEMREGTVSLILTVLIIFIIITSIIVNLYYTSKKSKNCGNMNTIYGDLNGKIRSIDTSLEDFQYTLRDYYIKSAYNACSGGNYKNDYVDTCILKDLLKQGVRGLDFQIFSIDDKPVVSTSNSDSYYVKETFNYVAFSEVMNILRNYAFSMSTAPNSNDPIILHLRINSTNQKMFNNFAKLLEEYTDILLGKEYSYEYKGKNLGSVNLSEFMGKVVIIVDRSNTSFLESQKFYEYVNMTSNSVFMRALRYYDIKYTPDMNELIEYNKQNMSLGMPDKGNDPENPSSIVMREMGCQMLGLRYQKVDVNVEENDVFFNKNGFAFVLKPEKLRYIPVTIPVPPPQDPNVSYATRTVQSDFYKFNI
jgi:hypothetical protein